VLQRGRLDVRVAVEADVGLAAVPGAQRHHGAQEGVERAEAEGAPLRTQVAQRLAVAVDKVRVGQHALDVLGDVGHEVGRFDEDAALAAHGLEQQVQRVAQRAAVPPEAQLVEFE